MKIFKYNSFYDFHDFVIYAVNEGYVLNKGNFIEVGYNIDPYNYK